MRLIFWGTPAFALPALRAVADAGHQIAAVVTRPDRPAGRGRKPKPSPVRTLAEECGYRVLAPKSTRDPDFVEEVGGLGADVSVVVAYGQILSKVLIEAPERGSLNVHPSLLPALRGAAPINWAIARGFDTTGVTIMRMVQAMDEAGFGSCTNTEACAAVCPQAIPTDTIARMNWEYNWTRLRMFGRRA